MIIVEFLNSFGIRGSMALAVLVSLALAAAVAYRVCARLASRLRQAESALSDYRRQLGQLYLATCRTLVVPGDEVSEEEFLLTSLEAVCRLITARYGAVGVLADDGSYEHFLHHGMSDQVVAKIGDLPRGRGLLGNLEEIEAGTGSLRLDDLASDPRSAGFPEHHPPMKTILVVPISTPKKIYGRLYLSEREDAGPFSDEDAGLARGLAQTMGLALESARLECKAREAEIQFQQAQKMETVGLLAGGVAHDFNNLLMVVGGNVEMAQTKLEKGQTPNAEMLMINEAIESAAGVVRQLLAFSRKQIFAPDWLEVSTVFARFSKMLGRLLREDIDFRLHDDSVGVSVYVDPAALEQVLMNLTLNARDAMPGGGRLTLEAAGVRVDADADGSPAGVETGDYVRVSVVDTGVGIDAATLERIFDPFFTTKSHGTGLGLSVVDNIVRQHGGRLDVHSDPCHGTRFDIYLPAMEPLGESSQQVVPGRALDPVPDPQRSTSATLLVAEDEERLRRLARSYLTTLGYKVLIAADGEEALQIFLAHQGSIDLVILDSVMPRLSGPTAYQQMNRLRPELPCIFVTGYSEEMTRQDLTDSDVTLLHKPVSYAELGRHVAEVLARRSTPDETCDLALVDEA